MSGTASAAATDLSTEESWSDAEVEHVNERLEGTHPREVLRWAVDAFPEGRLVLTTSLGVGGLVLLHLLRDEGLRLPVIFIDTLHHFPETLEQARRVEAEYDLDLQVYRPAPTRQAFEAAHGERLWERNLDLYHQLTKVEPMKRALVGVEGWITGRRRDQSESRSELRVVERKQTVKINPLADCTRDQVWTFVRRHGIPYNPLHDQGYASVGDEPLTTPVQPGESERAGRWRGEERQECGLHSF